MEQQNQLTTEVMNVNTNDGLYREQTVVHQIYEQLEVNDPAFWNANMIRDWLLENKERLLQLEKEQIKVSYLDGAYNGHECYDSCYGFADNDDAETYYNENYGK